jgi:plasmid stability protein
MLSLLRLTAREVDMATLTVRNLDEDVVRRLRIRAAEHGRSAEAEHREILRTALIGAGQKAIDPEEAAARLEGLRSRLAGRGLRPAVDLLEESRNERLEQLTGVRDGA